MQDREDDIECRQSREREAVPLEKMYQYFMQGAMRGTVTVHRSWTAAQRKFYSSESNFGYTYYKLQLCGKRNVGPNLFDTHLFGRQKNISLVDILTSVKGHTFNGRKYSKRMPNECKCH